MEKIEEKYKVEKQKKQNPPASSLTSQATKLGPYTSWTHPLHASSVTINNQQIAQGMNFSQRGFNSFLRRWTLKFQETYIFILFFLLVKSNLASSEHFSKPEQNKQFLNIPRSISEFQAESHVRYLAPEDMGYDTDEIYNLNI